MNITLHWPQITYLVYALSLAILICVQAHNLGRDSVIVKRALSLTLVLWLLWMGGFFGGACQ